MRGDSSERIYVCSFSLLWCNIFVSELQRSIAWTKRIPAGLGCCLELSCRWTLQPGWSYGINPVESIELVSLLTHRGKAQKTPSIPQIYWISVAHSNYAQLVSPNLQNCGWRTSHTSVSGKTHEFGNGEGKAKPHCKKPFSPPEVGTRNVWG